MPTTLTVKGQVTVPKHIRDAMKLGAGSLVDFAVNAQGEVVLRPVAPGTPRRAAKPDRFDAVRGSATLKGRTDELMKLLRD
jgi:AbrB family looped-hinge helix DNA binding protein